MSRLAAVYDWLSVPTLMPSWDRLSRPRVAAWTLSLVAHTGLVLFVAWHFAPVAPRGTTSERAVEVGLAVRPAPIQQRALASENNSGEESSPQDSTSDFASLAEKVTAAVSQSEALALSRVLPQSSSGLTPDLLGSRGAFQPGQVGGGRQGRGEVGGKARVSLFGITGEGYKFVYVFDRSDSMNWFNRRPLRAAKAELLASLEGLGETHQFQIIFYNHEPLVFNPSGQAHRLAFGTEENKARARRFIESITAGGGTRHMEAVLLGLSLQPDVIFLLTDADDPQLTDSQVAAIVRRAGGVTIHTIEFGYGPPARPNNFLVRLAKLTGGQHVYVDISRL
ncbi:MAG: hypothetical protein NZ899_11855 [Thermoguttaceae bacterium]|nr:hypothetical protein [Thermoguttaceae bacterium]